MVVPWRFRSDGCKFSEEDWECLRMAIIRSLHLSSIGLGGPLAYGTEWDDWFENLLCADGIGEKYWGESRGREWVFPRDKTAIQTVLRAQVVEMAGVERSKLKGKVAETLNPENETVNMPAGAAPESEPKDCVTVTGNSPTIADAQRRGPGRPKNKHQIPKMRSKKNVAREENSLNSIKRSRVSKEEVPEVLGASQSISHGTSDNPVNHNRVSLVNSLNSPIITQTLSGNPGLVFETRLANSQKAKFIYANDAPSLLLFFEKVREKFQLSKEQRIESIEVEIGSKVFVVDLDEERDWMSVIVVAEKTKNTGIGVVVGVV